jgi:hypothetical protein
MKFRLDSAAAARAEEALTIAQQLAMCGEFVPRPVRGFAFVVRNRASGRTGQQKAGQHRAATQRGIR